MSNIKLYSLAPVDRSARVRWFYEEAGIDFEQVWMNPETNEHMGDSYQRVNPFSKVPGVERDGDSLYESGAIILETLERLPDSSLAPKPGDVDRFEFLKWFMWGYQTLEQVVLAYVRTHDKPEDDPMRQDALVQVDRMIGPLDRHMSSRDFILGSTFSAADIVIGYDLAIAKMRRFPFQHYANVARYVERLQARPGAKALFDAVTQQ